MNNQNLTPWKSGQSGNLKGRPKKKLNQLKEGYTRSEINEAIRNVMSLTMIDLNRLEKDEELTVLELNIIKCLKKSIEKGEFDLLDQMITLVYGKICPQQPTVEWD